MNQQKQTMNTTENCTKTNQPMMTRSQRQQEILKKLETNTIEIPKTKHTEIFETPEGNIIIGMMYNPNEHDRNELNGMYVLHKKITDANDITNKKFEHSKIISFKVNGEEHKKKDDEWLDIIDGRIILLSKLCLASKLNEETIRKNKLSSVKMGKCGEKFYKYYGDKGPNISVRGISATYSIAQIKKLAQLLEEPFEITIEQKVPEFDKDGFERQTFRYHFA